MNFNHARHLPQANYYNKGKGLLNQQFHGEPIIRGGDLHKGSTNLILGVSTRNSAQPTGQQVPPVISASVLDNLKRASPIIKTGGSVGKNKRNNVRIVF
jgi:hypothetical protein